MRAKLIATIVGSALAAVLQSRVMAQEGICDPEPAAANLDFVLKDIAGRDVALSDYLGNVILLDFWATWCAPCRVEIPGFIELLDDYGPEGFVVLGISVDDAIPDLEAFVAEFEMDYPVLIGDGRDDVKDAYGPPIAFPTAFIIDRDGNVCVSHTGFAPKERFEQAIVALL